MQQKKKKLQLRYDPTAVPTMTEEETAVWRIDQRRQRNRESAALTRQKQRDRMGVLAVEVQETKSKLAIILARIAQLEQESGIDSSQFVLVVKKEEEEDERTTTATMLPTVNTTTTTAATITKKEEENIGEQSYELDFVDYRCSSSDSNSNSNSNNNDAITTQQSEVSPISSFFEEANTDGTNTDVRSITGIANFLEQAFPDSIIPRYHVLPAPENFISILPSPDECHLDDDVDLVHHRVVAPDYCDNRCNISSSSSIGIMNNNNNNNNNIINNSATTRLTTTTTDNILPTSSSATALNDELVKSLLLCPIDEGDVFPMLDDEELDEENHQITELLTDNKTTTEIGFGEYLLDAMEWPKSEHSISVLPTASTLPNDELFDLPTFLPNDECYLPPQDNDDNDNVVHHIVTPDAECQNSSSSSSSSIVSNDNDNNININININTATAADLVDSILFPNVDYEGIIEDKLLTAVLLTEKETDTDTETEDEDEFGEFLLDAMQWL